MKTLILALALFASAAHAEDAERLQILKVVYSCQLGSGIMILTQDKMGRIRQSPTLDYDRAAGQLMAIDRDGSFPIGTLAPEAYDAYRAVCDEGGDTLPPGVEAQLMPDLKIFLLKQEASRNVPAFNNCQGEFLKPWYARHCNYEPAHSVPYTQEIFAFVRQKERVDRTGLGGNVNLLK